MSALCDDSAISGAMTPLIASGNDKITFCHTWMLWHAGRWRLGASRGGSSSGRSCHSLQQLDVPLLHPHQCTSGGLLFLLNHTFHPASSKHATVTHKASAKAQLSLGCCDVLQCLLHQDLLAVSS